MKRDYPIEKSPTRRYPLPDDIKELDKPWADVDMRRNARVDLFRKGHTAKDDPTRRKQNISPSKILSKL